MKNGRYQEDNIELWYFNDELHREAKKHFSASSDSEFRSILEQTKGQQVAEQYRVLSGKIQIEKFAPFHNEEEITNLYNIINNLFHSKSCFFIQI